MHLASVNLPILGDKKYGGGSKGRAIDEKISAASGVHHMLHAYQIKFKNPNGEDWINVIAAPPSGFKEIMNISQFSLPN